MTWPELTKVGEGEWLELKGFLFQAKDGRWILSNNPDLKSCCVGKPSLQDSQITLCGEFSDYSPSVLLRARGKLYKSSTGYCLYEAEICKASHFPIWTTVCAGCVLSVLVAVKLKRLLLP